MAKKLNLDEYKSDTSGTHQAHNKYTRYFENELLSTDKAASSEGEPKNHTKENTAAPLKRINMAFTDNNYDLIMGETERLGISCVFMINTLVRAVEEEDIEKYLSSLPIRRTKNNIPRRKGSPQKRINLKFTPEAYSKAAKGAENTEQTITQYVNTVIEVYAKSLQE